MGEIVQKIIGGGGTLIKSATLTNWTNGGSYHGATVDLTETEKTELAKYNTFILYGLYEKNGFDYPFFITTVVLGDTQTILNTGRFTHAVARDTSNHYVNTEILKNSANTANNVRINLYDFGTDSHKSGKIYLYGIK